MGRWTPDSGNDTKLSQSTRGDDNSNRKLDNPSEKFENGGGRDDMQPDRPLRQKSRDALEPVKEDTVDTPNLPERKNSFYVDKNELEAAKKGLVGSGAKQESNDIKVPYNHTDNTVGINAPGSGGQER